MRISNIFIWFVLLLIALPATTGFAEQARLTRFHGVNLPQAGFAPGKIPGIHAKDYLWPSPSDIALYAGIGANIVRVAFLWERMQPALNQPLDQQELSRLDAIVDAAQERQVSVILDVHNYGLYNKRLIGSTALPISAFTDLWKRIALHYRDRPHVVFGLMNEPHKHDAEAWASIAQSAIDAIRQTGAKQTILVPGTKWSGAHAWHSKNGRLSNAEALEAIEDPAHNIVFEVHQYFDADTSGTHATCVAADIGVKRLGAFTGWLRKTGHRGFLGEFGASKDPLCIEALDRTLKFMADNNDVWYGWTYWAAAKWFGNYMFNIYPPDPERYPQVTVLRRAMLPHE
jgi:endoglucanase